MPFSFDSIPTSGTCEAALAYRVVDGSYGGVSLEGLKWILVVAWPHAIHEGDGRGVILLDRRAKGSKREALEAIATAKAGGPMRVYMSTMTAPPEVREAEIAFKFAGKRSAFRADRRGRVGFEPMRNPVTGEEHHFTGVLPTGLFTKRESFYSAKVFDVDAEPLSYRYPGRNAIASTSIWRGP